MVAAAIRSAIGHMHDAAVSVNVTDLDRAHAVLTDTVALPFPDGFEALPESVCVTFLELRKVGVEVLAEPRELTHRTAGSMTAGFAVLQTEVEERAAAFGDALRSIGIDPNDRFTGKK